MIERAQNISLVEIILTVIFALFGAALGSFLNVCIDRLPAGKSIISQPSHCDNCQRRLQPVDLVPVISYLAIRGRCRYCQAKIPARVLWVEVISAVLVAFLYREYGLSIQLAVGIYYCCLYLVIAFIDLEYKLILNKIVYPSLLIAIVINIFAPTPAVIESFWGDITVLNKIIHSGAILNSILGGASGFILLMIVALVSRGGMAFGDVKMAALIGMTVGFPMVFVSLVMAAVLGGLVAILLLVFKIKRRKDAIPFGPFLSLATVVTLIWGQGIMHWYVRMLTG